MEAGVLAGDVLMLRPSPNPAELGAVVADARDRIDDVISGQRRFWDPHAARSFVQWVALIAGAALLLPAAHLRTGPVPAALSATIAGMTALAAIMSDRRSETVCATVGLTLSCAWAGLAGAIAFHGWVGAAPVGAVPAGLVTLLVALGSALLLAGCAAASSPAALIHATALVVVGIACAAAVVAVVAGARAMDIFSVGALVAVLLLGGLPRLALATGGLVGGGRSGDVAELDHRIDRADRVLVGCLLGVSVVTAGAVSPAALSSDGGPRLLAVGIGLLLLLRSRAYSQARHVLPPRAGGLLVFGVVWLGVYLDDALPRAMLISGVALAAAVWVVGFDVLERKSSPVALARRARFLDAAEQVLVVVLILGMAWVVVLDEWVVSVVG